MTIQQTISPIDGSVYVERELASAAAIEATLARAHEAQRVWRAAPLTERVRLLERFCMAFEAQANDIALELAWQMGRPVRYGPNEVRGTLERARHMLTIAEEALADVVPAAKQHFQRFIRREPLGTVFVVAAWNYPYLIAVNSVVPALLAGNVVLLKSSAQTPLCAERFASAFEAAGLPPGVFQILHLSHADTERVMQDARVDMVAFTGSVAGGRAVQRAMAERFVGVNLELGGCDPAYVRHDADIPHAIENLVDGAFFNSGQSCCGIQRVYVDVHRYDELVAGCIELTERYVLGDPRDPHTMLGPVVRAAAADVIREQVQACVRAGARACIAPGTFGGHRPAAYVTPQILLDVDHRMPIMQEEIFGPVMGIMPVPSDEAAIELMNDSRYGLTAAVWTRDAEAAISIGERVATGTWFMNRCDYLDPALAWVGIKDSGRGCSLSSVGFEHLTRPKSFHLRVQT